MRTQRTGFARLRYPSGAVPSTSEQTRYGGNTPKDIPLDSMPTKKAPDSSGASIVVTRDLRKT
jgi:hypothetical protein